MPEVPQFYKRPPKPKKDLIDHHPQYNTEPNLSTEEQLEELKKAIIFRGEENIDEKEYQKVTRKIEEAKQAILEKNKEGIPLGYLQYNKREEMKTLLSKDIQTIIDTFFAQINFQGADRVKRQKLANEITNKGVSSGLNGKEMIQLIVAVLAPFSHLPFHDTDMTLDYEIYDKSAFNLASYLLVKLLVGVPVMAAGKIVGGRSDFFEYQLLNMDVNAVIKNLPDFIKVIIESRNKESENPAK